MSARYTEAAVQVSHQVSWFKQKEGDWKIRSTKVDAGDFKHELLNRLRSTVALNMLILHNKWSSRCYSMSVVGLCCQNYLIPRLVQSSWWWAF